MRFLFSILITVASLFAIFTPNYALGSNFVGDRYKIYRGRLIGGTCDFALVALTKAAKPSSFELIGINCGMANFRQRLTKDEHGVLKGERAQLTPNGRRFQFFADGTFSGELVPKK